MSSLVQTDHTWGFQQLKHKEYFPSVPFQDYFGTLIQTELTTIQGWLYGW